MRHARWARAPGRAAALAAGLFLVVGALQLMKSGAEVLGLLQAGSALVQNALSTLGLGWLGAASPSSRSPSSSSRSP